jgi:hypothetical protein
MHCIICYNSPILNLNSKTQVKKWLIIYNTTSGIIALRKHVNVNDFIIFKIFKKWTILWNKRKDNLERRDQICLIVPHPTFLLQFKELFKKDDQ